MPPEPGKSTSSAKSAPAKSLGDDKAGQKKSNSEMALQETSALEEELAALRATYEQYFLGNERFPPLRDHEDFKKRLLKLKGSNVRNTAAKFRLNSLQNKFLTYERLWTRTLQEIEAGTYKRDLLKAKRRAQKANAGERRQEAHDLTEEISDADLEDVSDIIPNEPLPTKVAKPAFVPQPVEPTAGAVSFRGTPAGASVPSVPTMAPLTPAVAPVIPAVAPVAGTPFRASPPVASGGTPAIPAVAPVAGTPFRGTPAIAPVAAVPSVPAVVPSVAPVRGPVTPDPVASPARGAAPATGAPARGAAPGPAGGTPARGTPGGTPVRGVPSFGASSPGGGGIAAALEGLTDEPLTSAPAARAPSAAARPGAPAGARPGAPGAARPAGTAAPAASRPAPAAGGGGLSDDKLRAVYDAYVTAKKRNQEDTSKMSFESVAANLRKQVPDLLKQHNAKNVEFKVVIKDGKATLKAVPK
ncbi:MXAN_5187 C-terminal domain-containing protein [Stigmatella aurantiaca]|uniref:Conserved uncharacterized protein n=1 Tax=Stigmatella aurantiaca (strain DW4/3-1) TaxID=378806 RepID=E3FT56_STIAD|nr:MXAN_5187 C-terminal domain-containing protein [Stigmatella aurantiaca]ADO75866.1 conserved uncharacterized protein [Stigmatella aurantiaca DW4/3-1]